MSNFEVKSQGDLIDYLGPDGPGVAKFSNILSHEVRSQLLGEMEDNTRVHWWDAGESYVNARNIKIIQNHDVFALKLSAGDQELVDRVPAMKKLANGTERFIRSLSNVFPSLVDWSADEMSYHRYYDSEIGLSYHRDNARFIGLIAVVSVLGEADSRVVDRQPISKKFDSELNQAVVDCWQVKDEYVIPTSPGDVVLTRATNLYDGMVAIDRPEHAVVDARVLPRVSFMLRANSKSTDEGYGFTYYNWP